MPAISNQSIWKTHPHEIVGYLAVKKPITLYSCRVNQTTFTYPLASLTVDNEAGDSFSVAIGHTFRLTSNAGDLKGFGRVRRLPITGTFYIGTDSQGELFFEDNDLIEVLIDARPWVKVPRLDTVNEVQYKDYDLAHTTYNTSNLIPVCVAGPDRAIFANADGYALIDFDLTQSYSPAGFDISSYAVDISGASVHSGTIASGIFTLNVPVGEYLFVFYCTDENGYPSPASFRNVFVFDDVFQPIPVTAARLTNSLERGWDLEAEVLLPLANRTYIENGSRVIFFVDEYYGTSHESFGSETSPTTKFVGYIVGETLQIDAETDKYLVKAQGPLGLADLLTSFTQTMQRNNIPTDWSQVKDLDVFRAIWYLLNYHSTLLQLFDSERPSWFGNYPVYDRLDLVARLT